MQDIHSIGGGGGGGRLYGGGGVGDRRLRQQHHHNHGSQAMKCPRCESINTKFCYYNNYNLSQPRHFCKSCRRYWTKGGVLRNVPVGGGCRKTKPSNPKQSSSSASASIPAPARQVEEPPVVDQRKSPNSHSSSESSSLTGTTSTTAAVAESVSVSRSSTSAAFNCNNNSNSTNSNNHSVLNRIGESKLFAGRSNLNPNCFETASLLEQGAECGIFPEMGSFTSLISSTTEFGFGGDDMLRVTAPAPAAAEPREQGASPSPNPQWKMQGLGLIDRTVDDEFPALQSGRSGGGGFGSLDWQEPGVGSGGGGCDAAGLFDLPSGVDEGGYWSQSQWTTTDQDSTGLFIP